MCGFAYVREEEVVPFLPSKWKQTNVDHTYTSHFPSYLCTLDQKDFIRFSNKNQISLSQHPPPRLKTIFEKKQKKPPKKPKPTKNTHTTKPPHIPNTALILHATTFHVTS